MLSLLLVLGCLSSINGRPQPQGGIMNNPEVLTEANAKYLSQMTGRSEELIKAVYEQYRSQQPTKQMSKEEFGEVMKAVIPEPEEAAEKLADDVIRIYDKDGSGKIDFVEYMTVVYILNDGSIEDVVKRIFLMFDVNTDGSINLEEMQRVVSDMMLIIEVEDNPEQATKDIIATSAFAEMDENEDGKISDEEFVAACLAQNRFSKMLVNKITQDILYGQ